MIIESVSFNLEKMNFYRQVLNKVQENAKNK